MLTAFLFTVVCWTLWWNLQWRRFMRFWLRPPNRQITQFGFRVFFALNFVGAAGELFQRLRQHPLAGRNVGPIIATAAMMLCVVGLMTAVAVWLIERKDRRSGSANREGAG